MQIVIEIPEDYYKAIKEIPVEQLTADMLIIRNGTPLDKIRAEIEEKYGDYDICEWFEDYDYEENDISEYQQVGSVSDILAIIDRYMEGK